MKHNADTSRHVALGVGGEFDIVREMLERWGPLATGIGDDAALVQLPGVQLVVSTDTSVEDVHFRKAWLTHREIAYRATAAALSDLAAMAATPIGVFLALTLPAADVAQAGEIAEGVGECVAAAGTRVLGGDVSRGERLSLTLTVIGTTSQPLTRGGARHGDRLYVTGRLGGPAAALREFEAARVPAPALRDRFCHPIPRLKESRWLADHGAHAAIDISDGLIADARQFAAASGARLHLRGETVPLFFSVSLEDALAGGEEYELLVACPGELDAQAFEREFGLVITEIGEVSTEGGPAGEVEVTVDGRRVESPAGYDHFEA